jgi:hypothetical protein
MGTQYLVTLASASMRAILDIGMQLTMPATRLAAKICSETGELFELREAGEGTDSAAQLQEQLEIVHRPHQLPNPLRLSRAITPCAMCEACHFHRLGAQIGTEAVLVKARESTHGLLDIHKQSFGEFHDGREGKGHNGLLSQKADY